MTVGGRDLRELRQDDVRRTFALAGQNAHIFNSTIRANLTPRAARTRPTPSSRTLSTARASASGSHRFPTGSTRSSARTARSSPEGSVSA